MSGEEQRKRASAGETWPIDLRRLVWMESRMHVLPIARAGQVIEIRRTPLAGTHPTTTSQPTKGDEAEEGRAGWINQPWAG